MDAAAAPIRRTFGEVVRPILKFLIFGALIGLAIFAMVKLFKLYFDMRNTLPTDSNNAAIAARQVQKYDELYLRRQPKPVTALTPSNAPLINYNILGCRNAGYLGPARDGVFSEDNAVRIALRAGCRAFCLNISTVESIESPVLIARSAFGDKISNNVGSIRRVCEALVRHAPRKEPIIVVLYFDRLPHINQSDIASVKFMMDVATSLAPLRYRHLGMTESGDYRRQAQQDNLFLRDRSLFDGKFIILTNADTSAFRPGALPSSKGLPAITSENDLDLWVHGRLFSYTTTTLGVTSTVGTSRSSGPRIETAAYYQELPEASMVSAIPNSKVNWTMVMDAGGELPWHGPLVDKILNKAGVSCLMVDVFRDDLETTGGPMTADYFKPSGWRMKPEELRYVVPAAIPVSQPNPQMNANGGFLAAPET